MRIRIAFAALCLVYAGAVGCGSDEEPGGDEAAGGLTFEEGVALPAGFPTDDVPLVDGLVTYAESAADYHGWTRLQISIDSEESFDDLVEEAVADLTGAGLVRGEDETSEGFLETGLNSDEHLVTLTVTEGTDRRIGLVSVGYGVVVVPDPGLSLPESVVPFLDGLVYQVEEEGQSLVVRMLVDGSISLIVAAVEARLTAAGLPTDLDSPPTVHDGTTYFEASSPVASVDISVGVDEGTGRTDLRYEVWTN